MNDAVRHRKPEPAEVLGSFTPEQRAELLAFLGELFDGVRDGAARMASVADKLERRTRSVRSAREKSCSGGKSGL